MIEESSLCGPSVTPVIASTVTREVISVPELVMNALLPSITHAPPVAPSRFPSRARVRSPPGAGAQVRQPAVALLAGPKQVQRHGAQADSRLQGDGHRGIDPGQFLEGQAEREGVAAHSAVGFRERQAEQPELGHARDDRVGKGVPLVVVADDRGHGLTGKRGDGLAQFLMLGFELETDHFALVSPRPVLRPRLAPAARLRKAGAGKEAGKYADRYAGRYADR